ncbi:MAG TPA: invasin domain 3-containing protein, partial [Gemmataceae bacterium]|nr:invasin domain 3-containing protein [Gemmataceae bacterium]
PNGSTVYTETQQVTGDGSYSTTGTGTGSDVATQAGTYYWLVSYSGNALNNSVTDNGQMDPNEQVTVVPGPVSLAQSTVSVTPGNIAAGGMAMVTLTARDAYGNQETGGGLTVTFALSFGSPGGVFTAIADNGNGTYSAAFTGLLTGTGTIAAAIGGSSLTSSAPAITVRSASNSAPVVAPPVDHAQAMTVTLGPTDGNGTALVYTAQVQGYNPLYNLQQQYALAGTAPYAYNSRGQGDKWVQSSNGSNAANGGWYVLMPTGDLYAWQKSDGSHSLQATLAITPVATNLGAAYTNPALLLNPALPYVPAAYAAQEQYAFTGTAPYAYSSRDQGDKWVQSGNGSNAANGGWYVLMPTGNLYAWQKSDGSHSLTATLAKAPVANVGTAVYQNPALLLDATPPGALASVSATVSANTLKIQDGSFLGTSAFVVTISDGMLTNTQTFLVTFTDKAPVFAPIANQTGSHTQPVTVSLNGSDADGDPLTYTAQVQGYNPLYNLEQQYAFTGTAPYAYNSRGQGDKWLNSPNSNTANGGWYVLMPTGNLYAWQKNDGSHSLIATLATTPVASNLGAAYTNPALLLNPALPYIAPAYAAQGQYAFTGTAPYAYNSRGQGDKWVRSTNGSNAVNGGWYVLMPTGNLYAWQKSDGSHSLTATLATTPVANVGTVVYQNPALLIDATPPGVLVPVSATLSGNTLTIQDGSFLGTLAIAVTASDGILTNTQTFLVTFT